MRIGRPIRWSQLALLLLMSGPAAAGGSPLFDGSGALEIELRGPLGETIDDTDARRKRPFMLTIGDASLEIEMRVRGKSRARECDFPPLQLRFADSAGTVFDGQDKLKLVTHCNPRRTYELNVLEEYLAYRVMALLTDSVLRVRLLRIRYVDTDSPRAKPFTRFGFVLESEKEMAARIGGTIAELPGIAPSRLERGQIATVFVGQYLLGNVDWSLVAATGDDYCCHNGIVVEVNEKIHIVPYDFDLAALVYPAYDHSVDRSKPRSRRYTGYCLEDLDLPGTINRVRAAQEDIFGLVRNIERVSDRRLSAAAKFLESFFREARDPGRLAARFDRDCQG